MDSVYDLIVIGSGPAGQRAAIYGSKMGKRVALVEIARGGGRRVHQHRDHSVEDDARGGAASLRLQLQVDLRHELPGEGKDHDGGPGVPGAACDQDRGRRDRGAALAQQHRDAGGHGEL